MKLAAAVKDFMRSGKFQFKAAATPRERQLRDEMKQIVLEMVGR